MYTGPYYFHQPGSNEHLRTKELLEKGIGDGIIIPIRTMNKVSENILKPDTNSFLNDCRSTKTKIFFDPEYYDPREFDTNNTQEGSKILSHPQVRTTYIDGGLRIQHELKCDGYIIPNFETTSTKPIWYQTLRDLSIEAQQWVAKHGDSSLPSFLTLAIPASDIGDEHKRMELLNHLTLLKPYVAGFYVSIIGIPEVLVDMNLFKGILSLVFWLKWQQFGIMLSKVGPWVFTTFPLGLDTFGNGGFKSQQTFKSRRDDEKSHGFGARTYDPVWSPLTLSYIRYPDDATRLEKEFSIDEKRHLYGEKYGFAPPIDRNPDDVYRSKGYKQNPRLNSFSAAMAGLAQDFRSLSLDNRISSVEQKLKDALDAEKRISKVLQTPDRGREKQMWLNVFNQFVEEEQDNIEELYS